MQEKFSYRFRKKRPLRKNPRMRSIGKSSGGGYNESKRCEFPGCNELTRERKPYCPAHIEEHPYIKQLLEKLEAKEAEEQRILKHLPPEDALEHSQIEDEIDEDIFDDTSETINDILLHLRLQGPRTIERLAREVNVDFSIVEHFVKYLRQQGKVELGRGKRGKTIVKLRESQKKRNPDYPLVPEPRKTFLSRQEQLKAPLFELKEYVDPESGALIPAEMPRNLPTLSMYGNQTFPRGAANFELLISGQSPFVIVPEGLSWKVQDHYHNRLFELMMNLDDINMWEQLFIDCGGLPRQGCKGKFGIFIVSRHNERYKLIDTGMDFGDESGWIDVKHIGPQGILRLKLPQDAYEYKETEEGIIRLPFFLPVIIYR